MPKPPTAIRVILFDLGSTLIYSKDPLLPIFRQADLVLVETLQKSGIQVEMEAFSGEFETFLDSYYAGRGADFLEKTTFSLLCDLLEQHGFKDVPASIIRVALDAMYSVTRENWYLEADAIPTLNKLLEEGYRLGMVSNTGDDRNVQQLIDRWSLRPFFDIIITSAGCGFRKPDQRIFQLALDFFRVPPAQVAMLGDTLEADILGANLAGFYSIWITRRVQLPEEGELTIQPQAVITALDQLPGLLVEVNKDRL
jgi:HAD superfamily hydrolase (TIGR01662 family)